MASDVTVELEGDPSWSRVRNIGHYGGALDKENSETEGRVPYAWVFYRELRGARGSAYRTVYEGGVAGLVHAENAAAARSEAARWRSADKIKNNAVPITSDELLGAWLDILNVKTYPGDTMHDVRIRCASKYQLSVGPIMGFVDSSVTQLLGNVLVRPWRLRGATLSSPPVPTYWPGVNAGPASYSLGGGAWLSPRAHYIVEVDKPYEMPTSQYLELVNTHLFTLLDSLLPAWATFDWAEDLSSGGFTLDVSDLDFGGLGP